jgi:hypothetical protein
VGLGTSELAERLTRLFPDRRTAIAAVAVLAWPLTSAALAVGNHFQTFLHKDGAIVDAFDRIGRQDDVCGVAVVGMPWWRTAGYTHLHRDVPIYLFPPDEVPMWSQSFNYVVGNRDSVKDTNLFSIARCAPNLSFSGSGGVCIFRRSGNCVASQERRIESQI